MNKDLIKKRFARSLKTYNEHAVVQKKMAETLISMLERKKYSKILEIGCGTGILTELAAKNLHFDSYTACDVVAECEKYIKNINPDIVFLPESAEYMAKESELYDLILANAVFQWLDDFEVVIKQLIQKLTPGGTLVFSTFGIKNFQEIYQVSGKSLKYYSLEELAILLKGFNYIMDEEVIILNFKTAKDVLKHMKKTGVNSISGMAWNKSDLLNFEHSYEKYCNGAPVLTYNPVYIKIENILK